MPMVRVAHPTHSVGSERCLRLSRARHMCVCGHPPTVEGIATLPPDVCLTIKLVNRIDGC